MVRREIAPTSQALQVAFSRLFREPMLSESTSFGSRWGIYEMSSSLGRTLLLPGASGLDRKPGREEAASGIWGADGARRRGFLELSTRIAPRPHRPDPGGSRPGKSARHRTLQRPGGPEGRKGLGAEPL